MEHPVSGKAGRNTPMMAALSNTDSIPALRHFLLRLHDLLLERSTDEMPNGTTEADIEATKYLDFINNTNVVLIRNVSSLLCKETYTESDAIRLLDFLQHTLIEYHIAIEPVERACGLTPLDLSEHAKEWEKLEGLDSYMAALDLWFCRSVALEAAFNKLTVQEVLEQHIGTENTEEFNTRYESFLEEASKDGWQFAFINQIKKAIPIWKSSRMLASFAKVTYFGRRRK